MLLKLQKFYDIANKLVFDNTLPKVKITLTKKNRKYQGLCTTIHTLGHSKFIYSTRIILCLPRIIEACFNSDVEMEVEAVLLHEMVHVWQGTQYRKGVIKAGNMVDHPKEVFDIFGMQAFNLGLIYTNNLLIGE